MGLDVKQLNEKLLELINAIDPPPKGDKGYDLFGKKSKLTGVPASEKAAEVHAPQLRKHNLKANFERLGLEKQIAPALLAGKGSRESGLGTTIVKSGTYRGWGDFWQRKGEKHKTYHGFGILQIDRIKCGLPDIAKELTDALNNKTPLDPFEYKWLKIGAEIFLKKLETVGVNDFVSAAPNTFATALSRYNGGKQLAYPNSDVGTTGGDYGNDTLVRSRWFAENWEKV